MDEEAKLENRLKKWWFYRKVSAVVLLVVLVGIGILITTNTQSVSYDFYVGVVTREQMSQQALDEIQQRLDAAAWDRNHDNAVRVLIWNYTVDWDSDGESNADEELKRLNADLGSKMSGLYLADSPEKMPVDAEAVQLPGTDLYAMLSPGHMEAKIYAEFMDNLMG